MAEEELREIIRDFKYFTEESKRLHAAVGTGDLVGVFDIQIGASKRDYRMKRKLEELDRKVTMVLRAMDESGLTNKEWSIVDRMMEGTSSRSMAPDFGCSHHKILQQYNSACKKMLSYLNPA